MAVVLNPESELAKEMAKWEQTPAQRDPIKNRYPWMLYKAQEKQGRAVVSDPDDSAFSQGCQTVVQNEQEHQRAKEQGWFDRPQDALDAWQTQQTAWADEAANVAYHVNRMGAQAQREYQEAGEATAQHVVDLQPVKRRRGPNKPKAVTHTAEE